MKFNYLSLLTVCVIGVIGAVAGAFGYVYHDCLMQQVNEHWGQLSTGGLLLGAAAPVAVLPKGSKDLEGVRGFLTTLKQTFASTAEVYEEPIRALFEEVKVKLEGALAALPATTNGNWSVNDQLDNFFNLLSCANNCVSAIGLELNKVKQQMAGMVVLNDCLPGAVAEALPAAVAAALPTAMAAAIEARTGETGDLVPKVLSQQLCSAAKDLGLTEGRLEGRAARDQELVTAAAAVALVETRKTALTTAGLVLPGESLLSAILGASDEAFAATQATATARSKKLTEAGIVLPPELLSNVWLADHDYKTFESTVMGMASLRRTTRLDEPLATSPAGAARGKILV